MRNTSLQIPTLGTEWSQQSIPIPYGGSVIQEWKKFSLYEERTSWQLPVMIENIRLTKLTFGVLKIIFFPTGAGLNKHVSDVEIKTAFVVLPFFVTLEDLQNWVDLFYEIRIKLTFFNGDNITPKEDCSLVTTFTTEDVNYPFLRQTSVENWVSMLAGLTFDVNSFSRRGSHPKIRRFLRSVRLVNILVPEFVKQIPNLSLVVGIVLTIWFVGEL